MGLSSVPAASLPVVDLTDEIHSVHGSTKAWSSKSDEVRRALEEYGCFIVEYRNISTDVGSKLLSGLEDLFNLPLEVKQQIKSESEPFRGYTGQLPGALYEAIGFIEGTTLEGMERFNNLMWPGQGNPILSESVSSLSKIMEDIGLVVTEMLFSSYDQSKNYESFLEHANRSVRVQNYRIPSPTDDTTVGIPPHVDKNLMTMLYQIQSDGLQVQTKNNGEWISIDYSPSSFIVMAAEALMAWSNGRIPPAYHKVSMENKDKARYSLGMFTSINGVIQAPEEMVDEEHPLLFKPYVHEEYMSAFYAKLKAKETPFQLQAYCGIN